MHNDEIGKRNKKRKRTEIKKGRTKERNYGRRKRTAEIIKKLKRENKRHKGQIKQKKIQGK
jgi:hypothetical protein